MDEERSVVGGVVKPLLEPKTDEVDDLLDQKLEQALHKQTAQVSEHDLAKIAIEHDPVDLARAVTRLPPSLRSMLFDNLPDLESKIDFMVNTGAPTRVAIFREMEDRKIKELVENTPPDEAVDMLDDLPKRRLRAIFELLEPRKATRLRELMRHGIHTAGRLMTNEFFAFHMDTLVGDVAAHIRDNPAIELTRRIFVLNSDGEVVGFVPGRTLIVNQAHVPLRQVMQPVLHKVKPEASRADVVDLAERYKIPALPVVDEEDRLIGVIAYEDVVDVMEELVDDTIASIAGTAEEVSEQEPILLRILWRAPWLLVTLCVGLISATTMSHFRDRPWFAFVPFFVPLITGMSGNVGIQSSTMMVRYIASGDLTRSARKEAVAKELYIGLLIGCIFGFCCGTVVYILNHFGIYHVGTDPLTMGSIVSCGIFGACLNATLLGSFLPIWFEHLGIDPAVAAGPIVTAFNDLLSTLAYLFVAWSVSSLVL